MNNLITAQDAFNAMLAGKNILCRAVGELIDFNDIDQFPATIFAKTGYEFCIKLDMIEVAGITFTKPLTLDEVAPNMDVFVVQVDGIIHHYKYNGIHSLISTSINGGFAQRDFDNAKLQYEALCKTLGGMPMQANVKLIEHTPEKSKRKPRVKEAQLTDVESVQIAEVGETVIQEDNLVTFDDAKNQLNREKSLRDRIIAALTVNDLEALLPELQQLHGESGHLIMSQYEQRKTMLEAETALSTSIVGIADAYPVVERLKSEISNANSIEELLIIEKEVSGLVRTFNSVSNAEIQTAHTIRKSQLNKVIADEEAIRLELLSDLVERAAVAQTPVEVNALFKYARNWTEEQQIPLHKATSKRLCELAPTEPEKAPLLMTQILRAPDLTTLDILEIDVGTRSPKMQPKFMAEILKRRRVLESQGVA